MNVLEVYPCFLPDRGGVERHIYDLCKCMNAKGHNPHVFTWMTQGTATEIVDGITVYRARLSRTSQLSFYTTIFFLWLQIVRVAHRYRIDVIHAHDYFPGLISALAGMLTRTPVYVTFHLPPVSYLALGRLPLRRILNECLICWVSAFVCVSRFTYQEMVRLGFPRLKLRIIYNWAHPLPRSLARDLDDAIERFHLGGRPFVLSVGRLVDAQKGFSILIKAFAVLVKKGHNMNLVIAGDGPDRAMLSEEASELGLDDRLHLVGLVSDDKELACLYQKCEAFVLPSRIDTLPLVLLEAMSFSKPIVATRVGGVPEVIEDGRNGILVEPSHVSLAEGMEMVLTDPLLRNRLVSELKDTLERFSLDNCHDTISLFSNKS